MKGPMIFVLFGLLATTYAYSSPIAQEMANKNIIDDALAIKECLERAIANIQQSLNNLLGSVNLINGLVNSYVEKLNACMSLGPIQQAACILNLVDAIKADVNNTIAMLQQSLNDLLNAGNTVNACFA